MKDVLRGVRVLELASWGFVPAAGAALADWGAEVIKVEHPQTGDPMRGLMTSGLTPGGASPVNFMFEWPNRGKKSVAIDIAHADGHELLMRIVETCDVFLTNHLPPVRRKLKVDVDDVRARNAKIIYARGSGQGARGPDAEKPSYDSVAFWSRGAIGMALTPSDAPWPIMQRTPAFGDINAGLNLAGGIAAAIAGRERTGETSIVDISLLSMATWMLSPMLTASKLFGLQSMGGGAKAVSPNVLVGAFETADGRHLSFCCLQPDKYWAPLCERLGLSELATDERFAEAGARQANQAECSKILEEAFKSRTLDEWRKAFDGWDAPWAPMQTIGELVNDPQVIANGYLVDVEHDDNKTVPLVPTPQQFDETPPELTRAPAHGQDTETTLLDIGLDWDQIIAHKTSGAIL